MQEKHKPRAIIILRDTVSQAKMYRFHMKLGDESNDSRQTLISMIPDLDEVEDGECDVTVEDDVANLQELQKMIREALFCIQSKIERISKKK